VPKLKHSAVERNRLKRRLRELARVHVLSVCSAGDLVLLARGHTYQADFAELKAEMLGIAETLTLKAQAVQDPRSPDTT
jgi:ribonuclease P protein component